MVLPSVFSAKRNFGLAILFTLAFVTLQLYDNFAFLSEYLASGELDFASLSGESQEIFRWENVCKGVQLFMKTHILIPSHLVRGIYRTEVG